MKNEMQITNREYTKYANMNLLYSRTSIYRGSANIIRKRKRERKRSRPLSELHDTGREDTLGSRGDEEHNARSSVKLGH